MPVKSQGSAPGAASDRYLVVQICLRRFPVIILPCSSGSATMFLQHKAFGFLKNKETVTILWKMSSVASRNVI